MNKTKLINRLMDIVIDLQNMDTEEIDYLSFELKDEGTKSEIIDERRN